MAFKNWFTKFRNSENFGYKIFCFGILFLLIIASYVKLDNGKAYNSVCKYWVVYLPFVVTGWISTVNAIRKISSDEFWGKMRKALILRTIPILVFWVIHNIIVDANGGFCHGFPIVIGFMGVTGVILASRMVKCTDNDENTDGENCNEECISVINKSNTGIIVIVAHIVGLIGANLTVLSSVLRQFDYTKNHFTYMKVAFVFDDYLKNTIAGSSIFPVTVLGIITLIVGIILIKLTVNVDSDNFYAILFMSIILLSLNVIALNGKITKLVQYELDSSFSSGAVFMIMGPLMCIVSSIYIRINEKKVHANK